MRILIKEKLSEHKSKTPEGYLICQDAILARTGTQDYLKSEIYENFDGEDTVVSVERKPEQVFSAEALASFEDKPITVEHPDENVNPDNYSELAVGHTRNIRKGKFNGQDVMIGDLVITDAQTIEDIENGVRTELSCGYDCDITEGDHPEQINIRGNHVALCEQGRAGIAKIIDSVNDAKYHVGYADRYAQVFYALHTKYNDTYIATNLDSIKRMYEAKGGDIYEVNDNFEFYKQTQSKWGQKALWDEIFSAIRNGKAKQIVDSKPTIKNTHGIDSIEDSSITFETFEDGDKFAEYRWDKSGGFFFITGTLNDGRVYVDQKIHCSNKREAQKMFEKYKKEQTKNVKDSKNSLDPKDKKQLSKYFSAVSKHMSNDINIEDIINPIKEMGYNPIRMKIDGWNKMDDGYYRKDYFFTFDDYDDIFMVSLYAKGNGDWTTDEVNAYFTGKRNMNDSILQEYTQFRKENEAKYGKDFMKYIEQYLSLPENSKIIEVKIDENYTEKRPNLLLSDLYNKEDEWNKFMNWYKQELARTTTDSVDEDGEDWEPCRWCGEEFPRTELKREVDIGLICPYCIEELKSRGEPVTIVDPDTKVKDAKTPWTVMFGWAMDDGDPYTGTAIVYAHSEDEAKEILKSYKPKATYIKVKAGKLVNSFDYPTYFVRKEELYEEDDDDNIVIKDDSEYKTIVMSELGPEMVYETDETITAQFPAEADAERAIKTSKLAKVPYDVMDDESAYYIVIRKDDIKKVFKTSMRKTDSGKYVLFLENGRIKGTSMENYNAKFRDASKIIRFDQFKTFEECIEYLTKYTSLKREDIVTIGDTEIEDIKIHDGNYTNRFYRKSLKELNKKLKDLEKVDDAEFDETASEYNSQKNSIYKEIQNQIKKYEEKLMKDEDTPLTEETKIKEWYRKVYSTDSEGEKINEKVTFGDLFDCLDNYQDVYKCIGVNDSIIRERCFDALAKIINTPYSYIYDQWLKGND